MGRAKFGLAKLEMLLENLKRDLDLSGTTLKGAAQTPASTSINAAGGTQTVVMTTTSHPPDSMIVLVPDGTGSNDIDITLPAPEEGLRYGFRTTANANANHTIFRAPSAILTGVVICDNGTTAGNGTTLKLNDSKNFKGTQIDFISDGVLWYVRGYTLGVTGDVAFA